MSHHFHDRPHRESGRRASALMPRPSLQRPTATLRMRIPRPAGRYRYQVKRARPPRGRYRVIRIPSLSVISAEMSQTFPRIACA